MVKTHRSSDAGMTLIELMAALVISGTIMGAIVGAIIMGLNTTVATSARLNSSRGVSTVGNYFPSDVASAAPSGIVTTEEATGCAGASPGTNLVVLPAAQGPGDVARRVAYRHDDDARTVTRYQCIVGSDQTARTIVASDVETATSTVVVESSGLTTVTIAITTRAPERQRFELIGRTRTPTAPTPLPDGPTATTAPPLPCKVDSSSALPDQVATTASSGAATLAADVTVTVAVSGTCVAPLFVGFIPDSATGQVSVPLVAAGSSYVATIDRSAYAWSPGAKTLTIAHAGPTAILYPTLVLTVDAAPDPCQITSVTASPNPVGRTANGRLASDVTVTVVAEGDCSALQIAYEPTTNLVSQLMTMSGANWVATIPTGGGTPTWSAGSHVIEVLNGTNAASTTLVVSP